MRYTFISDCIGLCLDSALTLQASLVYELLKCKTIVTIDNVIVTIGNFIVIIVNVIVWWHLIVSLLIGLLNKRDSQQPFGFITS